MDELDCHELPRTNRTFPDVDGQWSQKKSFAARIVQS